MNETPDELEIELRRLRPRRPSDLIEARLGTALETRARVHASGWLRGLAAACFAAALAWLAALTPRAIERTPEPLRPVAAEETLQSARDEGVVTLADGTPARRLRLHYVNTMSWSGAGRTLTWTSTREELRIVPVATY